MKKYLILFGLIFIVFVIYLIASFFSSNKRGIEKAFPTPTSAPVDYPLPTGIKKGRDGKIIINEKEVNDFFKFSKKINNSGDVELLPDQKNSIQYFPLFNSFLISINSSPFNEERLSAEREFLLKLGIDKDSACELSVNISTPASVNPEFAGRQYSLSFCHSD